MRQELLENAKRIVVKVGSTTVTGDSGEIDQARLKAISTQLVGLIRDGREVILVSSGAIAAGMSHIGFNQKPKNIADLQACASVGQSLLMRYYTDFIGGQQVDEQNVRVGQVLLTRDDIVQKEHYVNARNTINRLLELGVVPIINENDATVVEEIKYGDNDELAALVTNLATADLLVILSDVDGLYDKNPNENDDAILISEVRKLTAEMEKHAGRSGSALGSGGMSSKIKAVKTVTRSGASALIINGREENSLINAVKHKAGVGTFFFPTAKKLKSHKAWIAFATDIKGTIVIDDGAREAITDKKRSLLAAGVQACSEVFDAGETVQVNDQQGNHIATGIVNFSAKELCKIQGLTSDEVKARHPDLFGREVINRDYLVILK